MAKSGFDPVAAWQEAVQKWEQEINQWSSQFTESEQFSALMGQATKMSLVAQRALADQMETFFKSLNLPTKTQVDEIAERLDAMQESIDSLRLAIERVSPAADGAAAARPRRTRKPPRAAE